MHEATHNVCMSRPVSPPHQLVGSAARWYTLTICLARPTRRFCRARRVQYAQNNGGMSEGPGSQLTSFVKSHKCSLQAIVRGSIAALQCSSLLCLHHTTRNNIHGSVKIYCSSSFSSLSLSLSLASMSVMSVSLSFSESSSSS